MARKCFSFSFISFLFGLVLSCGLHATAWAQTTETTVEPTEAVEISKPEEPNRNEALSWPSFEKAFESGVSYYREKKYDEARLAFNAALEKDPNNVQALANLALVQFQLGQKGWAVALLRKAHNLDPNFSTPIAALDFILPQLDVKEIPHEIKLWEQIRAYLLVPLSLTGFLFLTAMTLLVSGWLLLRYFGRRKEAFRNEKPAPDFPVVGSLFALLFFASLSLTFLKFFDLGIPRATIVNEKVTVFSAPSEKSVALFDLYAGLEVVMGSPVEGWIQVTYPGASTGWVPRASVLQTSGRKL